MGEIRRCRSDNPSVTLGHVLRGDGGGGRDGDVLVSINASHDFLQTFQTGINLLDCKNILMYSFLALPSLD